MTFLDTREVEKVYFLIRQVINATLAQLIEHSIRNRKVSSLNLEGGSIINVVSSIYYENKKASSLMPFSILCAKCVPN